MVRELIERANGWVKIFATAILAAAIPVAIGFIAMGATQRQVEVNTKRLDSHLEIYTHETDRDFSSFKARIAVVEKETATLDKRLERLEAQNDEILRLLRKQTR